MYATADLAICPQTDGSHKAYIEECRRILYRHGLKCTLTECCTVVKGEWSAISDALTDCHLYLHNEGVSRVLSDVRIETRKDDVTKEMMKGVEEHKGVHKEHIVLPEGPPQPMQGEVAIGTHGHRFDPASSSHGYRDDLRIGWHVLLCMHVRP